MLRNSVGKSMRFKGQENMHVVTARSQKGVRYEMSKLL